MADQTVDLGLVGKIEAVVHPAVARMALGARTLIAAGIGAEGVDQSFFAEHLAGLGILILPGPVHRFHKMLARLGMAGETRLRHLGARLEILLQLLELGVIGGPTRRLSRALFGFIGSYQYRFVGRVKFEIRRRGGMLLGVALPVCRKCGKPEEQQSGNEGRQES